MVAKQKKSAVQNHCSTSAINSKKADIKLYSLFGYERMQVHFYILCLFIYILWLTNVVFKGDIYCN